MKQVWMTDDGKCFETELEAKSHEDKINKDVEFLITSCELKEEWIDYNFHSFGLNNKGAAQILHNELSIKIKLDLVNKGDCSKYINSKGVNTDMILSDIMRGKLKMIGTN